MVAPELRKEDAQGEAFQGAVMADCDEVKGLLSDYLDQRPGLDRAAVEAHLARCPRCAEFLEDLKAISRAFKLLPLFEPPEGLWKRAVDRARTRTRRKKWLARLALPAAAAAVFVLVVRALPRPKERLEIPASMGEARLFETFERERAEDALVGGSPVEPVRMLEAGAELAFYSGGRR